MSARGDRAEQGSGRRSGKRRAPGSILGMAPDIALRPRTDADTGFLRALYASTRNDELAGLGWTPEQLDAFLDLQFRAREQHYRRTSPLAQDCIVLAGE